MILNFIKINCQKCTSSSNCLSCKENFAIIGEDHSKCEDLRTKHYYKDIELNQYKECSYKLSNCEICLIDNNNDFICQKCKDDYSLKHEGANSIECILKSGK